jgi:hypothetical protein
MALSSSVCTARLDDGARPVVTPRRSIFPKYARRHAFSWSFSGLVTPLVRGSTNPQKGKSTMSSLRLQHDRLLLGPGLSVTFQRTLRIPDDGKDYPLPPGLGCFPVRRVDDYASRVPAEWRERGGVFIPMYQREAMWIRFAGEHWKPRAVKVGVGKVCAITGKRWSEDLHDDPQDYLVTPPQPWLDGVCVKKGIIRQFVAMPLGMGYTVEGQVTGDESVGGLQLKVFEPKPGRFADEPPHVMRECAAFGAPPAPACARRSGGAMGLAAGGRMKQSIYPDPHGVSTWDASETSRVFVHIVNTELWREITGERPPETPVTAKEYARAGLPWFELYDEAHGAVAAQSALADLKSVKQIDENKSDAPLQDDDSVSAGPVKKLLTSIAGAVRDGKW